MKETTKDEDEIEAKHRIKHVICGLLWWFIIIKLSDISKLPQIASIDSSEDLIFGVMLLIGGIIGYLLKEPMMFFGFGTGISDLLNKKKITPILNISLMVLGILQVFIFLIIKLMK